VLETNFGQVNGFDFGDLINAWYYSNTFFIHVWQQRFGFGNFWAAYTH
jgi:hypothetical protein